MKVFYIIFFSFLLLCICLFLKPVPEDNYNTTYSKEIFTKEGNRVRTFPNSNGSFSYFTKLEDFPESLLFWVIQLEDNRFYLHNGFDSAAILRSAYLNLKAGKIISGASTISMQVSRMLYKKYLPQNIYAKKILEIIFSIRLNLKFSKKEILEIYLNKVSFADNQEGFSHIAEMYFSKKIHLLTEEESLALVILLREHKPAKEIFRKRFMNAWKKYKSNEPDFTYLENQIFSERHSIAHTTHNSLFHFTNFSSSKSKQTHLFTSHISNELNQNVLAILKNEFNFLKDHGASEAAAIVLEVDKKKEMTKVISLVGSLGKEFQDWEGNGVTQTREAGSTLKPFVYALGFQKKIISPNTILNDEEKSFHSDWDNGSYLVRNNDLKYWGPMTVSEALANSRNVPVILASEKIRMENILQLFRKLEFTHLTDDVSKYGYGLALGIGGVSLIQLARAYSVFSSDGILYPLSIGKDRDKEILLNPKKEIFSKSVTSQIKYILSRKELRRNAFGKRNFLDFPFDVALKTGTSKDYRDSWTVGFTDKYVVAVWVGDFQAKRMNAVSGTFGAGRSVHQIFRILIPGNKNTFQYDKNLVEKRICRITGMTANDKCPSYSELLDREDNLISCKEIHIETTQRISEKSEILSPGDKDIYVINPYEPQDHQKVPIKIYLKDNKWKYRYKVDDSNLKDLDQSLVEVQKFNIGKHKIELYESEKLIQKNEFEVK